MSPLYCSSKRMKTWILMVGGRSVTTFSCEPHRSPLAIKQHVLRLAKGGVAGILVQGSNGEAQHLSHDERKDAIQFTRKTLNENGFENIAVIAGTGAQSTRETIKLCHDAKEAGASHVLVLTPSTWAPAMNAEAVLRFHRTVILSFQ